MYALQTFVFFVTTESSGY